MSGIKFTKFLSTQSLKITDTKTCCNEQHVRIARSMLYSDAFMTLNGNAMKLYMILRLKYFNEEENNFDFAFSKSLGVKILKISDNSEKTIRRSLKELVQHGFLDRTFNSNGGGMKNKISNRYKFSTRWKDYKKEYSKDRRLKWNK